MAKGKSNRSVGRPRTTATPGSDYSQWLMLVPKDKRKEVANFIQARPIKTYDALIDFNVHIMAALMEGRITPVIATELRQWHELNFSIIAAKNSASGTPQEGYTDVITALVRVKREAHRIRGDYFDAGEALKTQEAGKAPSRIEVKS